MLPQTSAEFWGSTWPCECQSIYGANRHLIDLFIVTVNVWGICLVAL